VATDDDDGKPPKLNVVSEKPSARPDRQVARAQGEVDRAISQFAAALLRTMAGSEIQATHFMRRLFEFSDTVVKFRGVSGQGLRVTELQKMLRLPQQEIEVSPNDWRYLHQVRERAMETIVKGALRLAAHKILGEEPHFGGKDSEALIEQGIKMLEEVKQLGEQKKGLAASWNDIDLDPGKSPVGASAKTKRQSFNHEDLRDLRRAIKSKDEKRIAELTAKLGKPAVDS
jgi:hypothetical protein